MTATCEMWANWDGRLPRCGEPAIGTYQTACEHEHISPEVPVCMTCAAEMQQGEWICTQCDGHPTDSHECASVLTFKWFAEVSA